MGVPDGRSGDVPLGRDEPRLRTRNARGYILYAASDNTWEFWLGTGSTWNIVVGPAIVLNQWTHLVATYDGTTARLYVNGALAGSSGATLRCRTRSGRCG